MFKRTIAVFFIAFAVIMPVFAQNDGATPVGANTAQDIFSPFLAGGGGFTTSRGGSSASALNPAAEGEAQRIIFDIGYMGLPSLGAESGFGHAFNIGAIVPTRYAVFGGSMRFLHSPFDAFPIGTAFLANLNVAKELYPRMSFGLGLNAGSTTGNGATISADLGFRYNMGDLGPLGNFTWALTARSLGLSWIPPMFTPAGGVSFDFLHLRGSEGRPDPLRMSLAADLMMPTFQNLAGKLGMSVFIAEIITISSSTQFNVAETRGGTPPSPIPSIGVRVNFQLQSDGRRLMADRLPTDGELIVDMAAKPLYNGIWAMGAGLTWYVGVRDTNPPRIIIDYPEPAWISPANINGRADYLEFPISITDERFVESWVFEIFDSYGDVVRTFRNKELRPETQGVRNFFDRVRAVKTGVEVPPTLRWDGIFETGEMAPDGRYYFTITATDDSGNTATAGPFAVYVDNTPPEITLSPFTGDENIFSPGDPGARSTLTITQRGSREDLWEAGIYNAAGNRVRSFNFENAAPTTIVWDGTDDEGTIVPDGVYRYRISATDRALNFTEASLENIIVNTIRPVVGLSISHAYFSPNGDGIQDTVGLIFNIPVREGIASWELEVRDNTGAARRTFSGAANIPQRIEFDGRDDSGRLLPEATYTASLSVRYRNGFISTAVSPGFTLDITPPTARVQLEDTAFSPTGERNRLLIIQEGSNEVSWLGEIRRSGAPAGTPPVRTFRFTGTPPPRIEWDGMTDAGALAPDGFYTYQLSSTDLAGNTGRSNIVEFQVDTRDVPVSISTDLRAFSPNDDGVRDTINLIPHIQERDGIVSWRITIQNIDPGARPGTGGGTPVRIFSGTGTVPAFVTWDGRTTAGPVAPDGTYVAMLEVEYRAGHRPTALSPAFILRTVPPQAELSVPFTLFAPNAGGTRDTLPINVRTEGNDEWNAIITDARNNIVRTWNWTGRAPEIPFVWDGRDQAGNIVPDGSYNFILTSTDEAGNSARRTINNIVVDTRVPRIFLTASAQAIAPRPNQTEAMRFNVVNSLNEGIESWRLELRDETGRSIRTFPTAAGGTGAIPANIPWNGANEQGVIQEGRFTPTLTVNYTKGDIVTVTAPPVLVNITPPVLTFRSTPEYFSPDGDGVDDELFIFLTATSAAPIAEWSLEFFETEGTRQLFWRIGGRGTPAERIIWDGRSNWGELVQGATDYRYVFRATDTLGNTSSIEGTITTDVLVIRDGDVLRIMVPSITFRANAADFIGIPQDRMDTNDWVLRRIAHTLNRFRDYRITVEGHANPILGTAAEEVNELQPLSLARARFVIDHLVNYGVSRGRLSAVGRGGTRTVADARDPNNNWKNRRVEFILIR